MHEESSHYFKNHSIPYQFDNFQIQVKKISPLIQFNVHSSYPNTLAGCHFQILLTEIILVIFKVCFVSLVDKRQSQIDIFNCHTKNTRQSDDKNMESLINAFI